MSVIPRVTCRRCGREYSGIRSRCPYCGTRRVKSTDRVPMGTASETPGTPASERAAVNTKWQMLFGLILLAAVVIAVIVLVTVSISSSKKPADNQTAAITPPLQSSVVSEPPVATPSPTPTPTPSPTPQVSSITITFLGSPRTEFAAKVGDSVPLKATVYPVDSEAEVTWSSEDESIVKVDQGGNVTAVGKGNTKIVVACGGVTAECKVYITG